MRVTTITGDSRLAIAKALRAHRLLLDEMIRDLERDTFDADIRVISNFRRTSNNGKMLFAQACDLAPRIESLLSNIEAIVYSTKNGETRDG